MTRQMAKATITVSRDLDEEVRAVDAWFAKWKGQLTYVSSNLGCGCCVDIYDVEGPTAAIHELPESVRTVSQWTCNDVGQ